MKFRGMVTFSIILIGLVFTVIHFKKVYGTQRLKTISLGMHHSFSKKIHDRLISFAREQEKVSTSPALLSEIIKESFPAVKKVKIHSCPDGKITVTVIPYSPLAVVNQEHLLTRLGTLINADDIKSEQVKHLPALVILQKDKAPLQVCTDCRRFISRLERMVYKDYAITWFDKNRVELKDKQEKRFTLLASNQTVFSDALFAQYKKLKQEVGRSKTGVHKHWYVDVRFKNQIVLFAQKGERG
jgi:hypothetical protein